MWFEVILLQSYSHINAGSFLAQSVYYASDLFQRNAIIKLKGIFSDICMYISDIIKNIHKTPTFPSPNTLNRADYRTKGQGIFKNSFKGFFSAQKFYQEILQECCQEFSMNSPSSSFINCYRSSSTLSSKDC